MAFPESRPSGYDADKVFDEGENAWAAALADLETAGGEKYKTQLIVVSNQGKIYFGGA